MIQLHIHFKETDGRLSFQVTESKVEDFFKVCNQKAHQEQERESYYEDENIKMWVTVQA